MSADMAARGWEYVQRLNDRATAAERWFGCPAMPVYVHGQSSAEEASGRWCEAVRGGRRLRQDIADPKPFRSNHRIPANARELSGGIPVGWIYR